MVNFVDFNWQRDAHNPVLPPLEAYDISRCMNPFAVVHDDQLRLYYSGGDKDGHQRICLATAPLDDPTSFTRHGVIVDKGDTGAFDHNWCVLPSWPE